MNPWKSIIVHSKGKKDNIYDLDENEKVFPRSKLPRTRSIYKELNIFKLIDKSKVNEEAQQTINSKKSFKFETFEIFARPTRECSKIAINNQSLNASETESSQNLNENNNEIDLFEGFDDFESDTISQNMNNLEEENWPDISFLF
ncbi:hypothetical protein M9Y10_007169 [Tritrichomonas musculus]|uniref:Uncharacterized protein n=1 Tax=Tritrichomonas musculus TaxID=1915356 RepID=A0ABR2J0M6_9EUKA